MVNTPVWQGATAGYVGNAGQVTQFQGIHSSEWIYSAVVLQSQQATGTSIYQSSNGTYYAQQLTTGVSQTAISEVRLQVSTVGGSPITATIAPLTVTLQTDNGSGAPSGTVLATGEVTETYVYSSPFWVTIPLLATGLTASSIYWLVTQPAGGATTYYAFQESNQVSGALTSTDGSTWTTQAYGLMYQVYDTTTGGLIQEIVDDQGAREATLTYTQASGTHINLLTGISEQAVTQGSGSFVSNRTITYSNLSPIGVA